MAKAPLPGRVKTRLAPAFGEQAAADLACSFLVDEVAAASGVGLPVIVATDDVATMRRVLPTETLRNLQEIWPQGPGKLGSRLEHVTARALRNHEFVVVIGADSPDLSVDLLLRAIALVRAVRTSVILGPAFDGGFYLLGTRVTMNGRFARVRLGSRHAREDTRRALRSVGLESEELQAATMFHHSTGSKRHWDFSPWSSCSTSFRGTYTAIRRACMPTTLSRSP